ncbi:MAG: transcription antitermination factor NusB [Actinobacteria bacterium]|nr:transcription antitermination factor NusB [Actinomycetota bacterium]MBU4450797.1 transcription antitermination factor NusB [Actinomycetota bacterium]MCG2789008.1 transcription antitermination factor NusB [Actinomycetes bacterium]
MVKITRRKSREAAVIVLYQSDLLGKDSEEVLKNEIDFGKKIDEFALELVIGVNKNRKAIDKEIVGVVENWTIERIAIIDRNILRVAIYEMLFEKDIPLKVSVDEAIEIAKSLGQKEDTPKFINGILGKILANIGGKLI